MEKHNQIERVCHFSKLFIQPDGRISPCCIAPIGPIGYLGESNIHHKLKTYYEECECIQFKNRKPGPDDKINLKIIRITFSTDCQASCLMCLADIPEFSGKFKYFNELEEIIKTYKPDLLEVSGGEITIQKDTMDWLERIKEKYNPKIKVITNGNLPLSMLDRIEKIFDIFSVSFVGFQPHTYKTIMGINQEKTLQFIEELKKRNKTKIQLKYLDTPINIHESPLFLEWALKTNPLKIYIHSNFGILDYINKQTTDNYWNELIKRTEKELKIVLQSYKNQITERKNYISFFQQTANYYNIDNCFLKNNAFLDAINIT